MDVPLLLQRYRNWPPKSSVIPEQTVPYVAGTGSITLVRTLKTAHRGLVPVPFDLRRLSHPSEAGFARAVSDAS